MTTDKPEPFEVKFYCMTGCGNVVTAPFPKRCDECARPEPMSAENQKQKWEDLDDAERGSEIASRQSAVNSPPMTVKEALSVLMSLASLVRPMGLDMDIDIDEVMALIRSLDERARRAEETLEHSHLGGHVRVCSQPWCRAAIIRADDGSRNCAAGHPARWVDIAELDEAKERARKAEDIAAIYKKQQADGLYGEARVAQLIQTHARITSELQAQVKQQAEERGDEVSRSSTGPGENTPYVPSWCYPKGPKICKCGHHEGYHGDAGCLLAQDCRCPGMPESEKTPIEEMYEEAR